MARSARLSICTGQGIRWSRAEAAAPLRARGTVTGGAIFLNWGTNSVVSLLSPVLLAAGTGTVFEIFVASGVIAFGLTLWLFPETTGRSLEQLELEQMAGG